MFTHSQSIHSVYLWFLICSSVQCFDQRVARQHLKVPHLLDKCGEVHKVPASCCIPDQRLKNMLVWY